MCFEINKDNGRETRARNRTQVSSLLLIQLLIDFDKILPPECLCGRATTAANIPISCMIEGINNSPEIIFI